MGARVIQFPDARVRRQAPVHEAAQLGGAEELAQRFHFWTGATGRRYVHTIYSLIECPALVSGNYVLVRRDDNGERTVLAIGSAAQQAASLNLADIRRRGAELGANEVHIHLLAGTSKASKLVEFDLRSGQMNGTHSLSCH
ncbi:MAG: hypothetical protein ABL894_05380 [Hyphomicrobium sp.]